MSETSVGKQIAPGMYRLEPVEIDPELKAEFLAGMSLEARITLGYEDNEGMRERRKRRLRLALGGGGR